MSKRGAEFYLTDRNYDTYDNNEEEDQSGETFKVASEEVLRQRKIKPLKRRTRPSFKTPTSSTSAFSSFNFTAPKASTESNSNGNEDLMKKKIKEFSEQICGLNESFVSFLSKSIKEDLVFDIALNIDQYKEQRKEIEKKYADVIDYLTKKNSTNSSSTDNKSKPYSIPSTDSIDKKDAKFSFNVPATESKTTTAPTFTFNKPTNNTTSTTTSTSTFKFTPPTINSKETEKKSENTPSTNTFNSKPIFSFATNNQTTKTENEKPLFSFNKPSTDKPAVPLFGSSTSTTSTTTSKPLFGSSMTSTTTTTSKPLFSFTKDSTATSTTTTTTTTTPFTFKKPEETKKESDSTTTTSTTASAAPAFKPFVFNFGQKVAADSQSSDNAKTLPKPNFLFGVAPPSKAEVAAAAAAASNDNDESETSEQIQLTTGAGEEDEDTIFEIKAKIHHYNVEDKAYVSRGVGLLKVNKNKTTNKTRLLARMDNGTVFLNVSLFKEMVVTEPVNANQFTFNAMDRIEEKGEVKMVKFVVRVKDKDSAKKLYNIIMENK